MKIVIALLGIALLLASSKSFAYRVMSTAPLARGGPTIVPVDVGPNSPNFLPALAGTTSQDRTVFQKRLYEKANGIAFALFDQSAIPSHDVKRVSPSLDANGNVIALTIVGDKFVANGPVVAGIFKASVTKFR